jgi:hypothetical protein
VPADFVLEIAPLDLGPDVRAIILELLTSEDREPARGPDAAAIWSRVLPAIAGDEPWALDFFSHLDRLREFSRRHAIACRDEPGRGLVIPAASPEILEVLFERFEAETFGARAGAPLEAGDQELETDLLHRGIDAYQKPFPRYFFCAICEPETGSLTLLSNRLAAADVARRLRPALQNLSVEVELPE